MPSVANTSYHLTVSPAPPTTLNTTARRRNARDPLQRGNGQQSGGAGSRDASMTPCVFQTKLALCEPPNQLPPYVATLSAMVTLCAGCRLARIPVTPAHSARWRRPPASQLETADGSAEVFPGEGLGEAGAGSLLLEGLVVGRR